MFPPETKLPPQQVPISGRTVRPALRHRPVLIVKRLVALLCGLPLMWLVWNLVQESAGPDPVAAMTRVTGIWALRFLLGVLLLTPIGRLTGWQWLRVLRRTVALSGFFYASLHLLAFLAFEWEFDFAAAFDQATQRAYLAVGLLAFAAMLPLAATSTNAMRKRLGAENWRALHRLAYVAAILSVIHFILLVKRDIGEPGLYFLVLMIVIASRIPAKPRLSNRLPSASR